MLGGAYAVGVAAVLTGADLRVLALLATAALFLPIHTSSGPSPSPRHTWWAALLLAVAAGSLQAAAQLRSVGRDCRGLLPEGAELEVTGVASQLRYGRMTLEAMDGMPGGCRVPIAVRARWEGPDPEAGATIRVSGSWRAPPAGRRGVGGAGELEGLRFEVSPEPVGSLLDRWRVDTARRVREVFPRRGALVSALVLAQKDGLSSAVREAFARAGTAHLLAISGFHVAVVAGLLLSMLRLAGLGRRTATAAAALGTWGYVAFIGVPDAAVRAALLLSLLAVGRCAERPLHAGGTLATAFLAMLVVDSGALARPGFQLSFAGAAGLVVGARRIDRTLARALPGARWSGLRSALSAGAAATVATAPVAAWHFDRASLVGIPATLLGTPLVALAIPGIFAALALHLASPPLGTFLAGGVELLLDALIHIMEAAAALPFAVARVDRSTLVVLGAGLLVGGVAAAGLDALRLRSRIALVTAGVAATAVVAPVPVALAGVGSVEIRVLDVGQGDAIALRSPVGRWLLVDAGPGAVGRSSDAFEHPVVRMLRRSGVRELAALVLTHPDLDHIGGAAPVIESLDVAAVGDPGRRRGTEPYVAALRAARDEPAPWRGLELGDRLEVDGMELDVLHPTPDTPTDADPNDVSVVILLRYGAFTALLTGDAPAAAEEEIGRTVGHVDVLKVAHHGSRTSSSQAFLRAVGPALSVVSVGRGNRYGHPHAEVAARLLRYSGQVLRTDRVGTVRIVARRDGSWTVRTDRDGTID